MTKCRFYSHRLPLDGKEWALTFSLSLSLFSSQSGLVSYSDDEDEEIEIEPHSATQQLIQNRPSDKNQSHSSSSSSNLGIKKAAAASTSSTSTPILQPPASNPDSQSRSEQHPSPVFPSQRPLDGQEQQPSSSTRFRALFFPPPRPKREAADHTLDQSDNQWDHEWDLGEEAVGEVDEALQVSTK